MKLCIVEEYHLQSGRLAVWPSGHLGYRAIEQYINVNLVTIKTLLKIFRWIKFNDVTISQEIIVSVDSEKNRWKDNSTFRSVYPDRLPPSYLISSNVRVMYYLEDNHRTTNRNVELYLITFFSTSTVLPQAVVLVLIMSFICCRPCCMFTIWSVRRLL